MGGMPGTKRPGTVIRVLKDPVAAEPLRGRPGRTVCYKASQRARGTETGVSVRVPLRTVAADTLK